MSVTFWRAGEKFVQFAVTGNRRLNKDGRRLRLGVKRRRAAKVVREALPFVREELILYSMAPRVGAIVSSDNTAHHATHLN